MAESKFYIRSFASGLNQSFDQNLIKSYEAVDARNALIQDGNLTTFCAPVVQKTFGSRIHSFMAFYGTTVAQNRRFLGIGTNLYDYDSNTSVKGISGEKLDCVNFQGTSNKVIVMTSKGDNPFYYDTISIKNLLNRRKVYDLDTGNFLYYIDANGNQHANENDITTYAPKGAFIELHYDRLWISGDPDNPDRLYFSTSNTYGADIQDFTAPVEESEANQHGGFIDLRTYDGSKIIGMKVIFNNLVIFKDKSAHKIFGSNPSNYQLVQLFSSNGAIADKSIVVGNNGAFFLNSDGIYFYDGTNTNLISDKITEVMKKLNVNYADKAVGTFYNSKYYVAIPYNGSTVNNLLIEYDTRTRAFMCYDIPDVTDFMVYNSELLFSSENYVKKMFGGTGGTYMYWESPSLDFQAKNIKKNTSYLYFIGQGNGDVKFTLTTERATKSITIALDGTKKPYKKKLKNKGRMLKLKIENINNSIITINSPELLFETDTD